MQSLINKIKAEKNQEIIESLERWPLLHFSEHAENIIKEGFTKGAMLKNIDATNSVREESEVTEDNEGYHFAFNTLGYCFERDVPDFLAGDDSNLMGMYSESAVLFLGSGLYTRHYDEFNQVIFQKKDVVDNSFLLLEEKGIVYDEDDNPICDENGNDVITWQIKDSHGKVLNSEELMNLEECICEGIHYLSHHFKLSKEVVSEFSDVFPDVEPIVGENIKIPVNRKKTRLK